MVVRVGGGMLATQQPASRSSKLMWYGGGVQVNPQRATSDGFAFNLSRVMLHLCAPFLDFYSGKARQFIDLRFVSHGMLSLRTVAAMLRSTDAVLPGRVHVEAPALHFDVSTILNHSG